MKARTQSSSSFPCRSALASFLLAASSALGLVSCGDSPAGTHDAGSGSGGQSATGSGGGTSSGGHTSTGSGGTTGSGGSGSGGTASGGVTGSGGSGSGGSGSGGMTAASGGVSGSASGGTTGSGGSTATGGSVGSGGSAAGGSAAGGATMGSGGSNGGGISPCKFASGVNVAWVNFANDSPNPQISTFNTLFKNVHDAGGRVVRWWFHTNGTKTPTFTGGVVSGLGQDAIDGVKSILASAVSNGVRVNISLWSFDMLQDNAPDAQRTANQKLLTDDTARQAYIDKALVPLVTALKGNPGLYSYEIFNEPEGMTTQNGWATAKIDEMYIQKTVNWLAAAIHDTDPTALVTNGAWTFKACSTGVSGMQNYYSDAALRQVGGKMNGTLDFYEVHYYTGNGVQFSPFKNDASHWGLDKKLVIGEFYAIANDGVNGPDTYTHLYDAGYNGAWAWQYLNDDGSSTSNSGMSTKWPVMQVPMQNVSKAHADVTMCP